MAEAMSNLSATETTVDQLVVRLERDGFAIVNDVLTAEEVEEKRRALERLIAATPTGRNDFEGFSTRRIYALFAKTRVFDEPATHPLIFGAVERVLGTATLSAPQAIQIAPGESAQNLHRDDGVYQLPPPKPELVVNVMWAIDAFTEENGATHVVPASHRWVEERPDDDTATTRATMPSGSAMLFLGSVYHGGGANDSDAPRLGVILEYCAAWLRQQENQYLAVPRELVLTLPPELQELLGYNMWGNLVGNVDGRHPRRWLERQQ